MCRPPNNSSPIPSAVRPIVAGTFHVPSAKSRPPKHHAHAQQPHSIRRPPPAQPTKNVCIPLVTAHGMGLLPRFVERYSG